MWMLMEVPETHKCQTEADRAVLFTLCNKSFVFCEVAAEISTQVRRPRLWYDVRLQGLYVGSAQLLELAYMWDPH